MLPVKSWTSDSVLRLFLGVLVCVLSGSVLYGLCCPVSAGQFVISALALAGLVLTIVLVHRPWTAETLLGWLIRLMLCFYAGLLFSIWAQKLAAPPAPHLPSVARMLLATLSLDGGALLLAWVFLRQNRTHWAGGFGLMQRGGRAAGLGLIAALVFLPIGWGVQGFSIWFLTHIPGLTLPLDEQLSIQTLRIASSLPQRLALGVVTILLAPAAEEVLFRGILYPWVKGMGRQHLALWGTVVLFALIHFNLATFLPLAVLALMLTGLYEWTGNLLAPIAAHAAFNAANFALLYLSVRHP